MQRLAPILITVSCMAASALADPSVSSHPLADHISALSGFRGSTTLHSEGSGNILDVTIDYGVFAPSKFPGTFETWKEDSVPVFPDPNPADYIYAYQIHNNSPPSTVALSHLNLHLAGGVAMSSLGYDKGLDQVDEDIIPSSWSASSTNVVYYFYYPQILPNEFSVVLLLSSPDPPTFQTASVLDGGLSAEGKLPSPVPAPGAAVLGMIGLSTVASVVRRIRLGRSDRGLYSIPGNIYRTVSSPDQNRQFPSGHAGRT